MNKFEEKGREYARKITPKKDSSTYHKTDWEPIIGWSLAIVLSIIVNYAIHLAFSSLM